MGLDAVVIGGGMVGCGLAYQLCKRGRKVLVIERRNVCSGATGRCGGMVMKIDGRDTDPAEITKRWSYVSENDRMLDGLEEELDAEFGLWRRGSLDIARTEAEMELLQRVIGVQKELGDEEIQMLEGRALRRLSPVLDGSCIGARYRPSDGCLDPFGLTHAFMSKAVEMGAEFMTRTSAEEILFDGDEVTGVRTERGAIESGVVVNATNGWAAQLTPQVPVIPLRSLAVVTEPAPPVPALTFEAELHAKIVYGCTQTRRGNILVGGPPEGPAAMEEQFDERVSLWELQFSSSVIAEMLPALSGLSVIRSWSGAMGITPDGLPCVGRLEPFGGLYVAAGYPNGMSYAPVTARLLAELIVEGESSIPLDALNPNRFKGRVYDWPEEYDYTVLAEFLGRTGQDRGNGTDAARAAPGGGGG